MSCVPLGQLFYRRHLLSVGVVARRRVWLRCFRRRERI